MQTNEYDINIYVADGQLKLLCYEMGVDEDNNFISTNTLKTPHKLELAIETSDPMHISMVQHALGTDNYWDVPHDWINEHGSWSTYWQDHDDWTGSADLAKGAPALLASWIESLPMYESPVTQETGML